MQSMFKQSEFISTTFTFAKVRIILLNLVPVFAIEDSVVSKMFGLYISSWVRVLCGSYTFT